MPSFHGGFLPQQLPLTPPDHYESYPTLSSNAMQHGSTSYYGQSTVDVHNGVIADDKYAFSKQPFQLLAAPTSRPSFNDSGRQSLSNYPNLESWRRANPVLPPIRVPETSVDNTKSYHQSQQASRSQDQAPGKEEKVAGGVAAYLDYDMEHMVDFVAESAQGMYELFESRLCLADIDLVRSVLPNVRLYPAFRKYVSQLLTSTRLPSSTILLGLHYLATRMTMLSSQGVYTSSSGHLYHMLTTALMLGSKFLDDNTFQNRSWAEVSNTPVTDLNTHELEWLTEIGWDLHFDQSDPQGFSAWLDEWKIWQAKKLRAAMGPLKLTPLDGNIRRQQSLKKHMPLTPVYTPTYSDAIFGPGLTKDCGPSHWQMWPPTQRSMMERSPPSAPHTGSTTPDWYGASNYNQARCSGTHSQSIPPPLHILPSSAHSPYYNSYSAQQYTPSPWNGHSSGCMCGYCLPYHDHYSMSQGYGAQTVVG